MRLRMGVVLWALSWVPYGVIMGLSGAQLTLAWTFVIEQRMLHDSIRGEKLFGGTGAPKSPATWPCRQSCCARATCSCPRTERVSRTAQLALPDAPIAPAGCRF